MRVILIGHGGRECALAWRIVQSPRLRDLIVVGANPGWPGSVRFIPCHGVDAWVKLAVDERADLVVVGPEAPLAEGLADALEGAGVLCFGPSKAAATLETSKAFAKEVMAAAGVPTAQHLTVERGDDESIRLGRARLAEGRVVIKVDGLAAGKGVFVCPTAEEASDAFDEVWSGRFGAAADRLVLEDLMVGPEVSVFGLSDGHRVVGLVSAQDHKTLLDGNEGPNTGGMGAYAPCPLVSDQDVARIIETVHQPVVDEMVRRGTPFRGVLFAGLMMTPDGPRVLEFNVRFGDPETQALMCLWDDDVLGWLHSCASGQLADGKPHFSGDAACCVVLASQGYPLSSQKGVLIEEPEETAGVVAFHAGTTRDGEGNLRTNGGRVLGITAKAHSAAAARDLAYQALPGWMFAGAQYRTDIGGSVDG